MSTTIKIRAERGTTTYECEIIDRDQESAEKDAASFEKWLNEQPERFQYNDTRQRSTR